jgi:hypothetical protein
MTDGFYKELDGKVFGTNDKGVWKAKAEPHQGGVQLTFTPQPEQENVGKHLLLLYIDDEEEKYTEELNRAIIRWIETTPKLRPSVGMFNPMKEQIETFRIKTVKPG